MRTRKKEQEVPSVETTLAAQKFSREAVWKHEATGCLF